MPAQQLVENPSAQGTYWNGSDGAAVSGSGYVEVGTWQPARGSRRAVVQLAVSGAALTGLKMSRTPVRGQPHMDIKVDTDFNALDVELQSVIPTSGAHTAAAGSSVELALNTVAIAEITIYAKSAGNAVVRMVVNED